MTIREAPSDWASVVRQKSPAGQLDATVHGALEVYDLPDLAALIGDDKLTVN